MKKQSVLLTLLYFLPLAAAHGQQFITTRSEPGAFPVAATSSTAAIYVDSGDLFLVRKAAEMLQQDIGRVTGKIPKIIHSLSSATGNVIIIGSLDHSAGIRQLSADKKLHTRNLKDKWEAYRLQVLDHPTGGITKALLIIGSDRRGTAYGVFTLSKQMGVSPWYWWADVPVKKKKEVFVKKGIYYYGPPAVKYRGIFLNDEAPALSGWVHEKYGGFNHKFYVRVFKLLLRLRANYLWPAMWGSSFDVDDTLNPILANKYGIVMGTAHNEPMMRSRKEWRDFGHGPWNYQTNADSLRAFWVKGIRRMDHRESIVTIGMRGNGDKPMSAGTNIALLEKIIRDQRKIITAVTGKPAAETPQDWALYKEVQQYYDQGMRVPDDVTLLYSDDNWGNIRRLPPLKDTIRKGGFGIYYHFDYVGGPRNYKWLNTNQISRVYEQMHEAYAYHARQLWVVNVGDLKPMEYPISFFLDYAYDANRWGQQRQASYPLRWAAEQFGSANAREIADILDKYTRYNSRRKPELLSPDTYSLDHYQEADRVVDTYNKLTMKAKKVYRELPLSYRSAFYQLVFYPVAACANLNDLDVTVAKNRLYAKQGRAITNELADSARAMFLKDSLLSRYYNKKLENGKWDHFMDQTHIGYTYWQQPRYNHMPEVKRIRLPKVGGMGVSITGSGAWWPHSDTAAVLPAFDPYQQQKDYIDIFNRGSTPFDYTIRSSAPWLSFSATKGEIKTGKRIWATVNWKIAPKGDHVSSITITGPGNKTVTIQAPIHNPLLPKPDQFEGFVEGNGYVSMEAAHYSRAVNTKGVHWQLIPGLGRTLSGMTPFPVTAKHTAPGGTSPRLEYRMYLFDSGTIHVNTYLSPTLDFHHTGGMRYAISIDDNPPRIVNMNADTSRQDWGRSVSDNIKIISTALQVDAPGPHVLKFWMVDTGVVLQKLVVDCGGEKSSYLGPPESFYHTRKKY
jgi:hypothetical protein